MKRSSDKREVAIRHVNVPHPNSLEHDFGCYFWRKIFETNQTTKKALAALAVTSV
jgi:hypothetical protein